jgi:hypothetical protein
VADEICEATGGEHVPVELTAWELGPDTGARSGWYCDECGASLGASLGREP